MELNWFLLPNMKYALSDIQNNSTRFLFHLHGVVPLNNEKIEKVPMTAPS